MTGDIPADTGSPDRGGEMREAAAAVRNRYKPGSPAYGFALSCSACGHIFVTKGDQRVPATELSGRLMAHVCPGG